ncbi:hypothetical protein FACS1894189_2220 [Planctomycetales bacterium]|nr:hypothetical protein FACS1894189_2220 [Planctomycetales bacterium]
MNLNRKEFLQTLGVAGAAVAASGLDGLEVFAQTNEQTGTPDLVGVLGGEPDVMFQKAITELGGISRFVKKGQKIVVKPNIGWDKVPEMAANTNPILISEIVKQAYAAGAAEVVVFDRTCDEMSRCYKNSGIEAAVKAAGGKIVPSDNEKYYREVKLSNAATLKTTQIHTALLDCDAWINVPVLKTHRGTKMTIAMKNYMGIVWDRRIFHGQGLDQCIADVCTWEKKPVLNVVDAYRIMKSNGPKGVSEADAVVVKALLASTNIVAIDSAATKLAQQFTNVSPEQVLYIGIGEKMNIGTTDLKSLNVKQIKV